LHDGYEVSLRVTIRGATEIESALNAINSALNQLTANYNAYVAANTTESITAQINAIGNIKIDEHQDTMHKNCIALNYRGESGEQGNLVSTTLATTVFQTDTGFSSGHSNFIQVARPNVARITSKNINFGALSSTTAYNLKISAGGMTSTLTVSLSSVIPTYDLDTIVVAINTAAHLLTNHYPISAYNTCGKLTIAHHIPGYQFTISIQTVSNSAATALGFADVIDDVIYWSDDHHAAYVGGNRINDTKSLIKQSYIHTGTPNLISLSTSLTALGFVIGDSQTGRLVTITNHTVPASNGSYYITSYPNDTSFTINKNIDLGTFDLEVAQDSVNLVDAPAVEEIHDIFLEDVGDGYGKVTRSKRCLNTKITGVNLVALNNKFPITGMQLKTLNAGQIQILSATDSGALVDIPSGYVGELEVYAPDNINSALVRVSGSVQSGEQIRNLTITAYYGTDDRLPLASVHYAGNYGAYTANYLTDRRLLGGTEENETENQHELSELTEALKELHNNGVISGLDVTANTTSTITVRGGKALVDGKIIKVETQTLTISDFTSATRLLLLDRSGKFIVKSNTDYGYTYAELSTEDGYNYGDNRNVAIIAQFSTNGTAISGSVYDKRLMLGNINRRLEVMVGQVNDSGYDLYGESEDGYAVTGFSPNGIGVVGISGNSYGVVAASNSQSRSAFRITPQALAPTNGMIGDIYVTPAGKLYICTNSNPLTWSVVGLQS
jgi:hypothetical protein